jgi:type II secretory pathway component PulL
LHPSDALPPLPQTKSFLPEVKQRKIILAARAKSFSSADKLRSVAMDSSIAFCK